MSLPVRARNDNSRSLLAFTARHRFLAALALVGVVGFFCAGLPATELACVAFSVLGLTWRIARHRRVSPVLLGYLRRQLVYGRQWAWTADRVGLTTPDGNKKTGKILIK